MDNSVISISREFGSGGRKKKKKLAAALGIPCYDRTIIQKTAEKSGLSPDFIARAEDRARSRFQMNFVPVGIGGVSFAQYGTPVNDQAFFAQSEVIRELADAGRCVIVGRCSDHVLGERPECIKIFIHADMASRLQRCREVYGLSPDGLEAHIQRTDKGRANYYNYYTGNVWGAMRHYDLTIDSGRTGVDGAVALIQELVRIRTAGK